VDPVDEEAVRAFSDPEAQAGIEEFHRQLKAGTLGTCSTS
jgi:hypothetical protein